MRKIILFLIAVACWGQGTLFTGGPQIPTVAVGSLPSASTVSGQTWQVNDANPNCGTGGGTGYATCYSDGTVWQTVASGTGGGSGPSLSVLTDFNPTVTSGTVLTISPGTYSAGPVQYTVSTVAYTLRQYTISAISSASSAILTISGTPSAGSLHVGDYVQVSGTTGSCSGLNGLQQITNFGTLSITIAYNSASCSAAGGGSAYVGANSSASGTAYVYGDSAGTIHIEHPTAAGMIVTCTGTCAVGQVTTPSFTAGGTVDGEKPIATATITTTGNGNWGTATTQNSFSNYKPLVAGAGIALTLGAVDTIAVTADVVRASANNTFTGTNSFGGAAGTIANVTGLAAALPATCTVGQTYFETDASAGANLYGCTSTNTWTALGGGGGGSTTTETREYPAGACSGGGTFYYNSGWSGGPTNGISGSCSTANSNSGYLNFYATGSNPNTAILHTMVPYNWSSGTVKLSAYWLIGGATADTFTVESGCLAAGTNWDNPTYNSTQAMTAAASNTAQLLTVASVTMTGCVANDRWFIRIVRTDANGHYDYLYDLTLQIVRNL